MDLKMMDDKPEITQEFTIKKGLIKGAYLQEGAGPMIFINSVVEFRITQKYTLVIYDEFGHRVYKIFLNGNWKPGPNDTLCLNVFQKIAEGRINTPEEKENADTTP